MKRICRPLLLCSGALALFCAAPAAALVERHSNGVGGGRWTDPETWHNGEAPAGSDHVVIRGGDTVVFDAGDSEQPDCAALSIDPRGVLTFSLDGRIQRLAVAGPVESYGTVRVDAGRDPESRAILTLASTNASDRVIRLFAGGALLFYGTAPGAEGAPNVELAGRPDGELTGSGDVMLDLQNVRVSGVHLRAAGVDNTGYRPLQRLNLVNNIFEDGGRVSLEGCDTAAVSGNRFLHEGDTPVPNAAIELDTCSLTDCRNNSIRGYEQGIAARNDVDSAVRGNLVSGARTGISIQEGRNAMLKDNRLVDCDTGLNVDESTGVVENLKLENVGRGVVLRKTTMQLTNVDVGESGADSAPLTLNEASAVMLNCNIAADKIKIEGRRPPDAFWARNMNYLIVQVVGKVPARAVVNVRTAEASGGAPDGAADLNVRNVPARLSKTGFTPFPRTLSPIVLKAWEIDRNRELRDAPFYDLTIMPVLEDEDRAEEAVLHKMIIEPRDDWFRKDPDSPEPTLKVEIK